MREILFRGKRADNGEWVEGNLFIPDKKDTPTQICIGTNVIRITYDIIPETVGQFTGLLDRKGKKIFEGDIVTPEWSSITNYLVEFEEERGGYFPFACGDGCGCCEDETETPCRTTVIGNIHDNPELLR